LIKPLKQNQLFDVLLAVLGQKGSDVDVQPHIVTRHMASEQRRQSLRILLAEDNAINQKLAVTLLHKAGYSAVTADNGLQAVEAVKQTPYHLILMDVQMPVMDGFEAVEQIRRLEGASRHTPIIAMTAHAMKGDRERCLEAGMDDYISKPLEPQELFDKIEHWTENILLFERTGHTGELQLPAEMLAEKVSPQSQMAPAGAETEAVDWQDFQAFSFEGTALEEYFEEEAGSDNGKGDLQTEFEIEGSPSMPAAEKPSALADLGAPVAAGPVNLPGALPRFNHDQAFFTEMLQEFVDHLAERTQELRAALQAGDDQAVNRLAHNLKGVAASFAADPLAACALELEMCGRKKDLENALPFVEAIERETPRLASFLEELKRQESV